MRSLLFWDAAWRWLVGGRLKSRKRLSCVPNFLKFL